MFGLLYEVTPEELAGLDAISGVDKGYYKQTDVEVVKEGQKIPAVTYIIPEPSEPSRPPATYTRPIDEAALYKLGHLIDNCPRLTHPDAIERLKELAVQQGGGHPPLHFLFSSTRR